MGYSIYRNIGLDDAYMPVDYNPDTTRIAEYADDPRQNWINSNRFA